MSLQIQQDDDDDTAGDAREKDDQAYKIGRRMAKRERERKERKTTKE